MCACVGGCVGVCVCLSVCVCVGLPFVFGGLPCVVLLLVAVVAPFALAFSGWCGPVLVLSRGEEITRP